MITASIPFVTRRAVNPILTDQVVFDAELGVSGAFLTPSARRVERFMPLASASIAGLFLLVGWLTGRLNGPEPLAHMAVLVAFVLAGIPGLKSAWESLLERRIDIDVLMILGACMAAIIGQPIEGALLLFLFSLSGALEVEATRRTQIAIRSLRELHPAEAIMLGPDGQQQRVATVYVPLGARLLVRPGDRVPLDGVVLQGESAVDEAPITGESMPRTKSPGNAIYAGSINGSGSLVIEATRVAAETQLARIIRMVTEAKSKQARVERLFDRIGPTYALCVIFGAVAFGALAPLALDLTWRESIYRAIALLIVASPCALIIATPIAYLSAVASAARRGVLIKGGVYLELLARCQTVVLDKTGTVTTGRPRLCGVISSDGLPEEEALRVAGALEASSSHPLAAAINDEMAARQLIAYEAQDVELVAGRGVRGRINGEAVAIGRRELTDDFTHSANRPMVAQTAEQVYSDGRTASVVTFGGRAAVLSFEDPIRSDARATIDQLRAAGIRRIVMLTGDNSRVARRTAADLGLDEFAADLLPEQKIEHARRTREASGGPVAMVGDGVNDAPVLAHADVGIAMATIGSDAALEAAPIVVMSNTLERVGWVVGHARRTSRIVRQNLALALSVIIVLSGFAVAGQVQLPLAVIAHEGSTLLVAVNALRLLRA